MKQVLITSIGGLGNQMFCYAFYKKMCLEYPHIQFKMDLSDIYDRRYNRNAEFLRVFPIIEVERASAKEIWKSEHKVTFTYRGKGSKLLRLLVDKCNSNIMRTRQNFCVTEEKFSKYNKIILDNDWKDINYFSGFWQDISYYKDILKELQKDFTFVEITDEENLKLIQQMKTQESVSVHVRRGDYVGETLDILDADYYRKIIQRIQMSNPESHFYFFSNDSEYVEKEFYWLKQKTIVKNNIGLDSFRDMQLMSMCKHNIIANSTFSIWSALLNSHSERKVYYPSHYYKDVEMQEIDLPGFVRVAVNG